ncbi:MAG: sialidase family protein [Candidatus Hydrogenedentota bacterium]
MCRVFYLGLALTVAGLCVNAPFAEERDPLTYRHFTVEEENDTVGNMEPIPSEEPPLWAREVSADAYDWPEGPDEPYFEGPNPFVIPPPEDSGEPFYAHNHQPSITYLDNGDLLAIWYTTDREQGTELTVVASRLRPDAEDWDPAYEFFKAEDRNMHGSSVFNDGQGALYHFNGMGAEGAEGWENLALLMRTSTDHGVTWTPPRAIGPEITGRNQVIDGTEMTRDGALLQPCDATHLGEGGTALHISTDSGETWRDPGRDKPTPTFEEGETGEGTIAGIHAGVVELEDGRLMALGRGDNIDGRMPMSLSDDVGETWTYSASEFPPIASGQRLVLTRLREGPILFVSFTDPRSGEREGMLFPDAKGDEFRGYGLFAALSYDEGETWPVRKLITPGEGEYDGGAHHGHFEATPTNAEHGGYLAATQTPDGVIHLISSRLHYRFNKGWLETPAEPVDNTQ